MSYQNSCTGCGLSVHDLPYEALEADPEDLLDAFFEHDDGGDLYCESCRNSGAGSFL